MKVKGTFKLGAGVALVATLALAAAGCAPAVEGSQEAIDRGLAATGETVLDEATLARNAELAQELADQSTAPEGDRETVRAEIEKTINSISERAFENLPAVIPNQDGPTVQLVPATPDNTTTNNYEYDYMGWNTIYLNANNRGCKSCHGDLGALVENMGGEPHTQLKNEVGIDIQARQCVDCHSYCNVLYDRSDNFANIMHSLHGAGNDDFAAKGGDCMSCHYVESQGSYDMGYDNDGEFLLWDNVKNDLFRGLTKVSADETRGTFAFDQTYTLSGDQLFNKNFFSDSTGVARKITSHTPLTPNPDADGIYSTWEIELSGDVENPCTMTIQEMIDQFGLEEDALTLFCDAGPIGTNLIGNYKIKGINLKKVMDYIGAKDDVTIIEAYAPNGHMYNSLTSLIDDFGAYLVLEVDGQPLPYQAGYPVQLWLGGASAWCNEKQVTNLNFVAADLNDKEQFPDWFFNTGLFDESNHSNYKPGVGAFDLTDGQVFNYVEGQPIHFHGYADAFEKAITAVEFSFDGGQTWVSNPTPDTNARNWVHWEFDWTPPAQGAYDFMIRAVDETGTATAEPLRYLVNVQDPENPIDVAAAQAKLAAQQA